MLVNRLIRRMRGDDDGSMLVSVLVIMLVLTLGTMTVASVVMNTTGMLVDSRSTAQSRAAADAGLADALASVSAGGPLCALALTSSAAPRYTATSSCGDGAVTIESEGRGEDGGVTRTRAVYRVDVQEGTLEGALVSANGGLNVSSIHVTAVDVDGDVVLNQGSLDCNNSTEIRGDVIVRNGNVSLSNYCHIHGDVIVSGTVSVSNHVRIGGSVYSMSTSAPAVTINNSGRVEGGVTTKGGVSMTSGGLVDGSITAEGAVSVDGSATRVGGSVHAGAELSLNSATVVGTMATSSAADASFWSGRAGAIRVNGRFSQLQATTVTNDVTSTRAGAANSIYQITVGGHIRVAGTYGTLSSTYASASQNVTGLTAVPPPSASRPWQLDTGSFAWSDLPFSAAAWAGAGYSVLPVPGCNFQNSPQHVTWVNSLTSPTILDARSCSELKLYQAQFSLRTDIVILVSAVDGQFMRIASADGGEHMFSIVTPDWVVNAAPSCTAEIGYPAPGAIGLSDVLMETEITGVVYSPCTIALGQSGSNDSRWNGQVYAGTVTWGGNSSNRMQLDYREVNLPGLIEHTGGVIVGPGSAVSLGSLQSLRDIP